jgi:hypothetical protein
MPSTPSAYPQVISRTFVSFHAPKSGVSAGQRDFWAGSIPGSSTENVQVKGCFHPQIGSSPAHPEKAHCGLAIKQRCGAKASFLLKVTSR